MHPQFTQRKEEGVSEETVEIIHKCYRARIDGKTGLQKELRCRFKRTIRGDLESKIQGLCEVIEGNLATGNSRLAYGAIRKFGSSGPPTALPYGPRGRRNHPFGGACREGPLGWLL